MHLQLYLSIYLCILFQDSDGHYIAVCSVLSCASRTSKFDDACAARLTHVAYPSHDALQWLIYELQVVV